MDLTYVDEFCDAPSEEDREEDNQPVRKRRRLNQNLDRIRNISVSEAELAVGVNWKILLMKETLSGRQVNYHCVSGRYRQLECLAGQHLLYRSDSNEVTLFETEETHENHSNNPVRGLPSTVKAFVRRKFDDGVTKPNHLMNKIRVEKLPVPHKAQLISFLQAIRVKKFGPSIISAADL